MSKQGQDNKSGTGNYLDTHMASAPKSSKESRAALRRLAKAQAESDEDDGEGEEGGSGGGGRPED